MAARLQPRDLGGADRPASCRGRVVQPLRLRQSLHRTSHLVDGVAHQCLEVARCHREPGCDTGTLLLRVFVQRRGSPVAAQCTKLVEGSRVACHVCQPCSRVQLGGRLSAS
jgi:hypothetical protein